MASLFVIGNGFDIAHGIKSNYSDFRGYLIKTHQGVKVGDDYVPPVPEPTLLSEYYDENEVVVTGMNSKEAGKACAEEMCLKQNGIFQKEKGVIVIGYKGAFSGCQLSIAVQRNAILRQLRQMQIFLIVIVLVFLFVAIVLAQIPMKKKITV